MNRKMIAIVLLIVIGVLGVSAFSWSPNHDAKHEGLTAYHLSERSSYAEFYLLATNQQGMAIYHQSERASYAGDQVASAEDTMANHWDAMAKFYAGDQAASAEDAMANHWDALAKFYAGNQVAAAVVYSPPGR